MYIIIISLCIISLGNVNDPDRLMDLNCDRIDSFNPNLKPKYEMCPDYIEKFKFDGKRSIF